MEFKQKVKEYTQLINSNLDKFLPSEDNYPENLFKSMRYSVFAGGKRLRPILALAACEMVGGNIDEVIPYACAIEMIHTWSLIHDDLPAIDNDDYRRGKLTNHKVFGEAMAILAGDGLLSFASEIMIKDALNKHSHHQKYLKAINEIITASGANSLISGEVVDIESEGKLIDKETLNFMYNNKTCRLIIAPARVGAILGNAEQKQIEYLTEFAYSLGFAFQIRDDILDIIGEQEKLGKDIGSDEQNNKSTFVSIYGLEESKQIVEKLSKRAIKALEIFGEDAWFLKDLAEYLISRES